MTTFMTTFRFKKIKKANKRSHRNTLKAKKLNLCSLKKLNNIKPLWRFFVSQEYPSLKLKGYYLPSFTNKKLPNIMWESFSYFLLFKIKATSKHLHVNSSPSS